MTNLNSNDSIIDHRRQRRRLIEALDAKYAARKRIEVLEKLLAETYDVLESSTAIYNKPRKISDSEWDYTCRSLTKQQNKIYEALQPDHLIVSGATPGKKERRN